MSDEFLTQFGDSLVSPPSNGGTTVKTSQALSGKIVMLYFSAHWCPPCRRFTPMLIEFYKNLKTKRTDFELVFISLDNSEGEYKSYTADMPWLCLPYEVPSTAKQKLASKYKAEGIPHLVVVDVNGEVITLNGTEEVSVDRTGENFPWRPKRFAEIFPNEILTKGGAGGKISTSTLDDQYLMLYFSAHWCPPCQRFTPVLSAAYTKLKAERDDFELVFVSSDRDRSAFDEYWGEMTFCALPFEERDAKNALSKRFDVRGIPTLIMLGPVPADGSGDRPLINDNLRGIIENGDFKDFPFHPKSYGDLSRDADDLNERKCLIIFHENGDDEEQKKVADVVKAVAEKLKDTHEDMKFYWALESSGLTNQIRTLLKMKKFSDDPAMVILDIPDEGGYYATDETDVTVGNVLKFIENSGERHQLSS